MRLIRWEPLTAMDDMFSHLPGLFGRWPPAAGNGGINQDWMPGRVPAESAGLGWGIRI
jgi:hypothetical protein